MDAGADKAIESLSVLAGTMSDPNNQSKLVDLEGTKYMACLDNMPATQVAQMMAALQSGDSLSLSGSGAVAALEAGEIF